LSIGFGLLLAIAPAICPFRLLIKQAMIKTYFVNQVLLNWRLFAIPPDPPRSIEL